ncbi:hypothetical protein SAMN05720758_1218 [Fibrobacter sp. UWB11]|nr:hypothetical protein SAMN05720758_1218 [Fibrobacter sp. UWB11]
MPADEDDVADDFGVSEEELAGFFSDEELSDFFSEDELEAFAEEELDGFATEELDVFAEEDCATDEELSDFFDEELALLFALDEDFMTSEGEGCFSTSWDSYFTTETLSEHAVNAKASDAQIANPAVFINKLTFIICPNILDPSTTPIACGSRVRSG